MAQWIDNIFLPKIRLFSPKIRPCQIGSGSSPNFFTVYQTNNSLETRCLYSTWVWLNIWSRSFNFFLIISHWSLRIRNSALVLNWFEPLASSLFKSASMALTLGFNDLTWSLISWINASRCAFSSGCTTDWASTAVCRFCKLRIRLSSCSRDCRNSSTWMRNWSSRVEVSYTTRVGSISTTVEGSRECVYNSFL